MGGLTIPACSAAHRLSLQLLVPLFPGTLCPLSLVPCSLGQYGVSGTNAVHTEGHLRHGHEAGLEGGLLRDLHALHTLSTAARVVQQPLGPTPVWVPLTASPRNGLGWLSSGPKASFTNPLHGPGYSRPWPDRVLKANKLVETITLSVLPSCAYRTPRHAWVDPPGCTRQTGCGCGIQPPKLSEVHARHHHLHNLLAVVLATTTAQRPRPDLHQHRLQGGASPCVGFNDPLPLPCRSTMRAPLLTSSTVPHSDLVLVSRSSCRFLEEVSVV